MTIHLVCYANPEFHRAQERLVRSANLNGIAKVHAFGPTDLVGTEFYAQHKAILDQRRGAGYWLWKPYFILRVLQESVPGDFVLYLDSGIEILGDVAPLVDVCRHAGGVLLFENSGRANRYWVKRDCFVLLDCDAQAFYDADQTNAAFCAFSACPNAEHFVEDWLRHCTDRRKLTDCPNECGLPDLPDFIEHRHDQAIISLLAVKSSIPMFRDPSQFGNHRKSSHLRSPGEYLELPYGAPRDDSPYPTLFNHHRDTATPPSLLNRVVARSKRVVRSIVPKHYTNTFFTPGDLSDAIRRNRTALGDVTNWFDAAADAKSEFGYGVPAAVREKLSQSVGRDPTVPDLIVHLCDSFGTRLRYLEIGVSVGKNFYQVLRGGKERSLYGFDIEEIHPNLTRVLPAGRREEFPSSPRSLKRSCSSLTSFLPDAAGNRVHYLSGDVLDAACWRRLRGEKFNFIFSDALHLPEGLMFEWRMIRENDLLNSDEFVMIWDDLGGQMSKAFEQIADQVQAVRGPCIKLSFALRGWMGVNEYAHRIGLVAKLTSPPEWLARLHVST